MSLILLLTRHEYPIFEGYETVTQACKGRVAFFANRGLVEGLVNDDGVLNRIQLQPGVKRHHIKKILNLRPPIVKITCPAEVVKVLPQTWTHRQSLLLGL